MIVKIHFPLHQLIFLCHLFIFTSAKALVGENVRQSAVGEFPFTVSLQIVQRNNSERLKHFCTGVLISNQDVLTSAHCLHQKTIDRVKVIIGSRDIREGVRHNTFWWLTFNEWADFRRIDRDFEFNDMAMLRLRENVTSVQPAIISNLRSPDLVNHQVNLAGWGKKEDGTNPFILETVSVSIISLRDCENRIDEIQGYPIYFDDNLFCTRSDPYTLIQQGDSGGPVIYSNKVIGLNKGTCPFPTVQIHPQKLNIHYNLILYTNFFNDVINNI